MDSIQVPRRLLRLVGRLVAIASMATLVSSAACSATAFADTLDERNELVNHFVTDFNANPLMADCAAHGSFVASTSTALDLYEKMLTLHPNRVNPGSLLGTAKAVKPS